MGKLKTVLKIGICACAAAAAVSEIIYEGALNTKLIKLNNKYKFFTDKETDDALAVIPERDEAFAWADTVGMSAIATEGENYGTTYAYKACQKEGSHKWAIINHGYSDEPKNLFYYGKRYFDKGYNVILPCMKGHGIDDHTYCSMGYYEKYIVLAWINYILKKDKDAQIVLHGVSMGSATTMLTTGECLPDNVKCAVADCGYTSCWDEYSAQITSLFHLPKFPFLYLANAISKIRGNFDFKACSPIIAVANSFTPTLFIHGEADDFVPYEMMDKLYTACNAPKDKLSVPEARHSASSVVAPEMYWNKVFEFTEKYVK